MLHSLSSILVPLLLVSADVDLSDLLPGTDAPTRAAAFAEIAASRDTAFTPPLLDLLALATEPEEWFRVIDTLGAIRDEDLRGMNRPWRTLSIQWLEANDRTLPTGYAAFKSELYAKELDPALGRFLQEPRATTLPLDEVTFGGVGVDGIPALDDPKVVAAGDATFLTDAAPVFGVVLAGEARAYPVQILDWHEMVNDIVGGVPVSLSWCTLCGAPILYRGMLDGERITFGSSGLLARSNKLMYDRTTDSLWNQFTGKPVIGPLAGRELALEVLPLRTTTFGAWRSEHPETTVVSPITGYPRDYTPGAAYGEYFSSPTTMFPSPRMGNTFRAKERIVVVRHGAAVAAVRLADIERAGLVHVDVGGRAVVVIAPREPKKARLDARWRAAILAAGGDAQRPSPDDLEAAVRAAGCQLPKLDEDEVASLPRTTRTALLASAIEGVALDPAVRHRVAVRNLFGDARAYESDGLVLAPTDDPGRATDALGIVWIVREEGLVASNGATRARVPSHPAFGFAWDAYFSE